MPKKNNFYAVILAGGSGERFWPMSTARRPKQFLNIPAGKPLICAAVERIEKLIPKKRIFIITRKDLAALARRVLPDFPAENVIAEPYGRDTAAAVALAAGLVKSRSPGAAFCVLTSDHLIKDEPVFLQTLNAAFRLALASDCLVTIGIKPSFPSTGFGYIEAGQELKLPGKTVFAEAKRFVEKPDLPTAGKYMKSGRFYWNSGMFVWALPVLEAALAEHCPRLLGLVNKIGAAPGPMALKAVLKKEYAALEKISVDYALMEKAANIVMAKSAFRWDDVGSWAALEAHCKKDSGNNVVVGNGETFDAAGNIAVAEDGLIALVGVRDLVVVRSGAATLVCAKSKAQDVKQLVARMKKSGKYKDLV
ncbi:MAG: sugar phosphate nucleotidyltransferase [Kiritimatiellae bacterium]|nr:sugar phosphate nucleotidyltransferase [Kiritimatiellia bacterium]